eukprot:Nitzschia sp. Nitz4//scaffold4_size323378//229440//231143//NITZ4_000690-RA/size323378-processed-gene-0.373-mRNA-1//-1//CDS//3329553489//1297//frame0
MNLELLDPFRRQIPDRVDATLNLPAHLHYRKIPPKETSDAGDEDWKAANHVAFNRRGAYVAVAYGSGTVAVYDMLSRTLVGVYRAGGSDEDTSGESTGGGTSGHGITCLSWSRRSRTLLCGAAGAPQVLLIDTTHPNGPEDCVLADKKEEKDKSDPNRDDEESQAPSVENFDKKGSPYTAAFLRSKIGVTHHRKARLVEMEEIPSSSFASAKPVKRSRGATPLPNYNSSTKRFPALEFKFSLPIGSTLQVHPMDSNAGLAALNDGSLVVFWAPMSLWEEHESDTTQEKISMVTIHKSEEHFITCAAFDPHGDKIYAATKTGKLLGLEVSSIFHALSLGGDMPQVQPDFVIPIPGGSMVWHLIVSRNGRRLIVNSADAAIRLYNTKECWTTPEEVDKPTWVFQDVVSKVKFASCDFSGDGEFVLGGANGGEDKYELYIWNTSTGTLMDKLTGASVDLYSVTWHPTRSFVAVAASDGLVDIWGPRINWTAFAPDFQALPQNVEYVECEDEFDVTEDTARAGTIEKEDQSENADINVLAVDPVPVFASDSEDEEDVFHFETKVKRIFGLF